MTWRTVLPALLLLGAASAASLRPDAFLLDRAALEGGAIWRLWTGHLVHHTPAHFAFDVATGMLLVLFVRRPLAWLLLPPLVGGAVLLGRPDVVGYAGLSGVLHGFTVIAAADFARTTHGPARRVSALVLAGVCAKALLESALGASLFSGGFDLGAETIHLAHLAGAAGGLALVAAEAAGRACLQRSAIGACNAP